MAIFHLSIRPISRGKGHSAFAQIAYDTRSKLTDERTGQKHDWSKHHADVIESQIIGPVMTPGQLAVGAELAEKRYDARVGRAMDVALPHELGPRSNGRSCAVSRSSFATPTGARFPSVSIIRTARATTAILTATFS